MFKEVFNTVTTKSFKVNEDGNFYTAFDFTVTTGRINFRVVPVIRISAIVGCNKNGNYYHYSVCEELLELRTILRKQCDENEVISLKGMTNFYHEVFNFNDCIVEVEEIVENR